jgi:membrane protein insertase Oxa1/YidC/SpoIIIJ
LKQQNNYPPGEQISSEKKLNDMQGEVKKLQNKLGKLTQDSSATSTHSGNHNNSSKGVV